MNHQLLSLAEEFEALKAEYIKDLETEISELKILVNDKALDAIAEGGNDGADVYDFTMTLQSIHHMESNLADLKKISTIAELLNYAAS